MKKNFWVLLCTALAMFSMASCSQDETAEVAPDVSVPAVIEAPVVHEAPAIDAATRTFITVSNGVVGTKWSTKEVIGVFGNYGRNVKFTSSNKTSAENVTFTGAMLGSPKYAYYPYSTDNSSASSSNVSLTMPNVQPYSGISKTLTGDFRLGKIDSYKWYASTFDFKRITSIIKVTVDATGTALEGSTLVSVTMKTDNRKLSGDFTANLQSQSVSLGSIAEGDNTMKVWWEERPLLSANTICSAYFTTLPTVQSGDEITFVVETTTHTMTVKATATETLEANGVYNYPLLLSTFEDAEVEGDDTETPDTPTASNLEINSFKFTVDNNPGKILPRSFSHNSSFTVSTSTSTEVVCEVDNEARKIKAYVPYLNNRTLVPTYTMTEGILMITYDGTQIVSDQTAVDFVANKQIAIGTSNDNMAIYDIELTNTGLPVVVINQQSGLMTSYTEDDSDYRNATKAWIDATGTYFQPKDSDWSMEDGDSFMIYNADGTSALKDKNGAEVTEPVLASTRVRGNVSQQMPKKPFAVKLDKKHAVLDMPAHKRWVLLANWKDRTLMRNEVAFEIAKAFKTAYPNDGMAWNPSGQHVELVYNGVYVGNYYLCEQIKIDGNRLDINEPYDAEDNAVAAEACGILMESDDGYDEAWQFTTRCRIPFLFKDDGTADMLTYASTLVQGIEDNLNKNTTAGFTAAYETMDITSFVDFLLVQDLMMNSEMKHPKSCYSYINNGKLYAGPVWDFDWNTLPTSTSYSEEGYSYTKSIVSYGSWSYKSSAQSSPSTSDENYIWYPRLMASSEFMDVAKTRWAGVQGQLSQVLAHIDEVKAQIAKSEAENAKMWPVDSKKSFGALRGTKYGIGGSLGMGSGAGFCGDEGMTFDAAVEQMKETLSTRISGMSNNIYK
ncbi:MAG: CotH kinase family protein [Alistipes sp.]|nr:CotH kinase family protein [Alistipes sp.]